MSKSPLQSQKYLKQVEAYAGKGWEQREYKRLAQRYYKGVVQANKRLERIEKYSTQEHYKGLKQFAYATAGKQLGIDSDARVRFSYSIPADIELLRKEVNILTNFLYSPSSTKEGITKVYKDRADTFNKNMRKEDPNWEDLSWQDLASYWEGEGSRKLDEDYGYKTLLKAMSKMRSMEKEKGKNIKKVAKRNAKTDDVVDELVAKLQEKGYSVDDLLSDPTIKIKK